MTDRPAEEAGGPMRAEAEATGGTFWVQERQLGIMRSKGFFKTSKESLPSNSIRVCS